MKLGITAGAMLICGLLVPAHAAADLPGKAVFDRSCKNCHGPEGKGDNLARKFYKVNIPRLDSAYVQGKSDADLGKIITGGVRKMEPVRMGAPSVAHRPKLTAEQVGDVIAYVRTLKP
jgi:mono/diheme cytochrome c family protein